MTLTTHISVFCYCISCVPNLNNARAPCMASPQGPAAPFPTRRRFGEAEALLIPELRHAARPHSQHPCPFCSWQWETKAYRKKEKKTKTKTELAKHWTKCTTGLTWNKDTVKTQLSSILGPCPARCLGPTPLFLHSTFSRQLQHNWKTVP